MISIIIPLYNKEKCIERTINSVLQQTYSDFELIIVDDGSTDKSSEIVKAISDKRIKYIYKQNGGVSSARNYGLEHVSSDWVVFLDADDTFFPNALENFKEATINFPFANVIVGGFMVKENNEKYFESNKLTGYVDNPAKSVFLRTLYLRPGNTLISKNVYNKGIVFIDKCSFNEDWIFGLNLLLNNKIAAIDKVLMCYDKSYSKLSNKIAKLDNDAVSYLKEIDTKNNLYAKILVFEQYYYAISLRRNNGEYRDAKIIERIMKEKYSLIEILTFLSFSKLRNLRNKFSLNIFHHMPVKVD